MLGKRDIIRDYTGDHRIIHMILQSNEGIYILVGKRRKWREIVAFKTLQSFPHFAQNLCDTLLWQGRLINWVRCTLVGIFIALLSILLLEIQECYKLYIWSSNHKQVGLRRNHQKERVIWSCYPCYPIKRTETTERGRWG